jgi:hypothetical protein
MSSRLPGLIRLAELSSPPRAREAGDAWELLFPQPTPLPAWPLSHVVSKVKAASFRYTPNAQQGSGLEFVVRVRRAPNWGLRQERIEA